MILLLILSALLSTPRSSTVRRQFQRLHPCPATGSTRGPCPGYVVDHLVALRCGGRDAVENMRWEPGGWPRPNAKTARSANAVRPAHFR
jgi:hypothetical protein